MPSRIQVVDTAAMSPGAMPASSSTPRTQPRTRSQLCALLRGGYLDVLITDEDTAQLLLEAEP